MNSDEFGRTLRELRQSRRLTLRGLAATAGISPAFLTAIEHGQRLPSPDVLRSLAESLGVDPAELRSFDPRAMLADVVEFAGGDTEVGRAARSILETLPGAKPETVIAIAKRLARESRRN